MLYTVMDVNAVLYPQDEKKTQRTPSSNPFDYIRTGYYLDNAALFGGKNHVNYHLNIPSNITGNQLHHPHQ